MALITIQSGPRNARTDPETGLRFYAWEGRELPSATSIRRMAGIPHRLHQWSLTQVIDHAVGHADEFTERRWAMFRPETTEEELAAQQTAIDLIIRHELRAAATAERDRAGKLGTDVHDAAAAGLLPEQVDETRRPRLRQYYHWLEYSGAEILGSEFQVWNLTEGYAGTTDLLVRLRDGSVCLIDLKTGGGIYSDYLTQLIAYFRAEFVGTDNVVDERLTELLRAARTMALLHLADDHWEFLRFEPTEELWGAFIGLLRFAVFSHVNDDPLRLATGRRKGSAPESPTVAR